MINTKIQWADSSINFWTGCEKVSEGCKGCYLFRGKERFKQDASLIERTANPTFYEPLRWSESKRIFANSWSDFFIEEGDVWRKDAWDVIKSTPHHNWLILTKRPERILECLPEDWGEGWNNVWLGVSVENQKRADERIPILLNIPAKIKFLSCEPLLENIDISKYLHGIHWNIIGGESGYNSGKYAYRPCKIEWIQNLIEQSRKAGVAVFIKQLGTHLKKELGIKGLHGGDMNEFPEELKIREYPKEINALFKTEDNLLVEQNEEKTSQKTYREKKPIPILEDVKQYVETLTPFKKKIAEALLTGTSPDDVAWLFSSEGRKSLKTYKAYVTMVLRELNKCKDFQPQKSSAEKYDDNLKISDEEIQLIIKSLSLTKMISIEESTVKKIDALLEKMEDASDT